MPTPPDPGSSKWLSSAPSCSPPPPPDPYSWPSALCFPKYYVSNYNTILRMFCLNNRLQCDSLASLLLLLLLMDISVKILLLLQPRAHLALLRSAFVGGQKEGFSNCIWALSAWVLTGSWDCQNPLILGTYKSFTDPFSLSVRNERINFLSLLEVS